MIFWMEMKNNESVDEALRICYNHRGDRELSLCNDPTGKQRYHPS